MRDPHRPAGNDEEAAGAGLLRRYAGVAVIFAVLAVVVAVGWADRAPETWTDWLIVVGLTPAGVAGVLIGDRFGLWLKDRGIGRR